MDESVRITDALTRSMISTTLSATSMLLPGNLLNTLTTTTSSSGASSSTVGGGGGGGGGGVGSMNPIDRLKRLRGNLSLLNPVSTFMNLSNRLEAVFKPSEEDIVSCYILHRIHSVRTYIAIIYVACMHTVCSIRLIFML